MSDNTRQEIESKISALRAARKSEVDGILKERQIKNDEAAGLAGTTPAPAALTVSELEIIENRYNSSIAGLSEQLRLLRLDEIEQWLVDESPDVEIEIEEQLEKAKGELAAAEQAKTAFVTKKRNYESHLRDRSTGRIRFKPQARLLSDPHITSERSKEITKAILHY